MPGRHSHSRMIWLDVGRVVLTFAIILAPLGILAMEMMGGGGFGGGSGGAIVSGGGGTAIAPAGPRSAFSAWKQRRAVGSEASSGFGSTSFGARSSGSSVPFSASWRAEATPELSGGRVGSSAGGSVVAGGSAGSFGPEGVSTGGRSQSYSSSGRSSSGASESKWAAEAQQLASRAQALSRQLGQVAAQDPVNRSLGEEAAPSSGSSGGASAEGPTSSATSNPPTPQQPTLPIDDHVHWLLVAGLLWGVWRLTRG